MNWHKNDGGRQAAGFKGKTGDCAVRAIAIATGNDYKTTYQAMAELCKKEKPTKRRPKQSHPRTGVHMPTMKKFMADLGWVWVPTMRIGSGCRVHLDPEELPQGRIIVRLTRHYSAVIDGTIHDTYDPSREGTRCVYGYWHKP